MKKTKIDRSIDTEALGFQVRESYKTARTNIAYSIFKKGCKKVAFTSSTKGEGKTVTSINVASALAQQVGNTAQETEQANEASQTPTAAQTYNTNRHWLYSVLLMEITKR